MKRPLGRALLIASLLSGLLTLAGVPGADASERPQPPTWEAATESQSGVINLSWQVRQGTEGVNVYRDSSYIATVKGDTKYRDLYGQPDSSYALVAFRDGEYSSMSGSKSPERIRPTPPRIRQLGDTGRGYISLTWFWKSNIDGVNVYRNNQYISTVRSGTVYNDYAGRVGDEYSLVSFRDDLYSSHSRSGVALAGSQEISAAVELQPDSTAVVIRATEEPGIRSVLVYRKDTGGQFPPAPGPHKRIGVMRNGYIVDSNPVRGATYGVFQVLQNGVTLPVVSVTPEYTEPLIRIQARCNVFSDTCSKPFGPAGPGTKFDEIEVLPVDPSLPDFGSNLMYDPIVSVLTEIYDGAQEDGLARPTDGPRIEVPLNELTDPDNDGLSVLSDTDNDNDGVPTWEDDNDTNPNIGRPQPQPTQPNNPGGDDDPTPATPDRPGGPTDPGRDLPPPGGGCPGGGTCI